MEFDPEAVVWQDRGGAWLETGTRRLQVPSLWPALEAALDGAGPNAWAVGFCSYEWAPFLEPLVAVPPGEAPVPLAWWGVMASNDSGRRLQPPRGPWGALRLNGCSLADETFRLRVAQIREAIAAGSVYQVNLTRRWQADGELDPPALFAHLAGGTMPRYAAYLSDGHQGWAVLCLSPELLLARRGRRLETRPIKGTRRKFPGPGGPARAHAELAASPKDAAELAMIVDLERNDLHRVCLPGSVRAHHPASTLMAGEVVHREAVVAGELMPGVGWLEILRSVFPGGSVTGAPKLAACRVIADLEPVPRGVYCGLLGVVRASGDGVLSLPIPPGVAAGGFLSFHAGGGIVWDSDPVAEEQESRDKVAGWLRLVGEAP
jgi:anthranilate/para-aminobenzoate synthase component I